VPAPLQDLYPTTFGVGEENNRAISAPRRWNFLDWLWRSARRGETRMLTVEIVNRHRDVSIRLPSPARFLPPVVDRQFALERAVLASPVDEDERVELAAIGALHPTWTVSAGAILPSR